ncbi:alcohol dehydrogenase catalytic domain-containing protein [Agriterribacter sp.]|uniref:zinc-dependent alcohol dehydrogenase n=1 Tax=Agriterribacter sp. TaxID=2821509 RepID=UPI002B5B8307|nr:alcohol dehydrogenase catalytic domain-containing protein [Agriterribacter sp.]HRO47074.1 alcohol dehydrogenase catalytic domain-containing protein [Agriterribacter sp.]HRQ18755.1 alcohol dehydrogenase catalytic domain-containing protein [Agriterribacter sp.]
MADPFSYMKSLQLQGLNRLVKTDVPVPVPRADEVLIKTKAATICTSDLHDIKTNAFGIKYPRVMGHEGAGIIFACGSDVKDYAPGTRVAAHPVVPCMTCSECMRGLEHLCSRMSHLGIDRDGCFAEYFVQRADRVRAIPDNISFPLGALLEPVAVCLEAISRSNDIKGKTVLVAGDGPFGNIIARLANRAGAARVLVSGREPFRLQMIPGVEIADTIPVKSVDVAILAVSASSAVETCLQALRPRGRLVVFSTVQERISLSLFNIHVSELEIVGACNDENKIDESLQCLGEEGLALEDIITHHIPFNRWEEAFDLARNGHNRALKVALVFD